MRAGILILAMLVGAQVRFGEAQEFPDSRGRRLTYTTVQDSQQCTKCLLVSKGRVCWDRYSNNQGKWGSSYCCIFDNKCQGYDYCADGGSESFKQQMSCPVDTLQCPINEDA